MDRSSQSNHAPFSTIQRDTRDPNAHPILYPAFLIHRNSAIVFVGLDWDENLKLKALLSDRGYRVSMRLRQIPEDTIARSSGDYLN